MTFLSPHQNTLMPQKEIKIQTDASSFSVYADEFDVQYVPYRKRYRIVSTDDYFQKVIGNSTIIIALAPTVSYSPMKVSAPDPEHDQLVEAIYQALALELASSI